MIQEGMGYGLAFLTGLFMGAHCVGMCGGFVLAYVTRAARDGKPAGSAPAWYGAAVSPGTGPANWCWDAASRSS